MSEQYTPSGEFPSVSVNEEDALDYMSALQESGAVNMLGAGSYLERDLDLNRSEARQVVMWWIS
jgi:hypothetical protein